MNRIKCSLLNRFILALSLTLCISAGLVSVKAQTANIEIEVGAALENAQVLSLSSLGIDKNGAGPVLVSGLLENLTNDRLDNLYFDVEISASRFGVIVLLEQERDRPFSLDPFQSIYATNNNFADESIPGIEENISFTGGLTPEGDEFINSLEGSTTLPTDVYNVKVDLVQITAERGRQVLSTSTAQIGQSKTFESSEIYLRAPGSVVGDRAEITNLFPQFSWEGESEIEYRLLVVESNGQDTPETLLNNAASSPAVQDGGSLLQFENLDVLVTGNSYQYPASGAQPLEQGNQYFWRVITTLTTNSGTEERTSEIWSFNITGGAASNADGTAQVPLDDDINEVLTDLLGDSQYNRLIEDGYALDGVEFDGQVLNGLAAAQLLREIMQKIRDGEIVIAEDQ